MEDPGRDVSHRQGWVELCDGVHFRQVEVYGQLQWVRPRLDECRVALCPFGGPIALCRGEQEPIEIYTASGVRMATTPRPEHRVLAFDWTDAEELVVVYQDGVVDVHTMLGHVARHFTYKVAVDARQCIILRGATPGIVLLDATYRLWRIPGDWHVLDQPVEYNITTNMRGLPLCMEVVGFMRAPDEVFKVLISPVPDGSFTTLLEVTPRDCVVTFVDVPVVSIAASPDARYVATLDRDGVVVLRYADMPFDTSVCQFDILDDYSDTHTPTLRWCGLDALAVVWTAKVRAPPEPEGSDGDEAGSIPSDTFDVEESYVVLLEPEGSTELFTFPHPTLHSVTEVDGLRLASDQSLWLLQRVPEPSVCAFGLWPPSPAMLLYFAWRSFVDPAADSDGPPIELENTMGGPERLAEGVWGLLEAAGHEIADPPLQTACLQAASYGRGPHSDADLFVHGCNAARVLRACWDPAVGIPITYGQFAALPPDDLVRRLLGRGLHALACRVADELGLPGGVEHILLHWACAKVRAASRGREEFTEELTLATEMAIVEKLKGQSGKRISFALVADTANKVGWRQLAARLVSREPRLTDHIHLLLYMQLAREALARALVAESGDTELIVLCAMWIRAHPSTEPEADFDVIMRGVPAVRALLLPFCSEQDTNLTSFLPEGWAVARMHLRRYCALLRVSPDKRGEPPSSPLDEEELYYTPLAHEVQQDILPCLDLSPSQRDVHLAAAREALGKKAAQGPFVEAQYRLHQAQVDLERESALHGQPLPFVGLSVLRTIEQCLVANCTRQATNLLQEHDISKKQTAWVRLRAAAARGDWADVERLAVGKQNVIGYYPYAEACMQYEQYDEAMKYAAKVTCVEERITLYCRLGRYMDAATEAAQQGNDELLGYIYNHTSSEEVRDFVKQARARI